jgi:phosphate:Na+ symporter
MKSDTATRFTRPSRDNPRRLLGAMTLLLLIAAAASTAANLDADGDIDWLRLLMGLFGGLALFLFGMEQMSNGLKAAAGESLRNLMARLTKNRFLGALTGAFVTAVLNSSSVTTVLVVGFITAGIMSFSQSVGVIMGANIGSTFTAQIVAFNITQYALLLVAPGFLMLFAAKRDRVRHYGEMLMGLGLIFFGMGLMSEAMNPLRSYAPFLELMQRLEDPIFGILVGAVFTGLVQSSAATTGIAIVMATDGLISLPAGIALAFGSNIGTCVTAILAAIGKPVEAARAAAVHVLFNVLGVMIWVFFIPQFAGFVENISPSYPELSGTERMAAEVPRQIANAHTLFNVVNTLIFIWFTVPLANLVERLLPDRPEPERIIVRPKFLDKELLKTPALALERARFEIGHLGEILVAMLNGVPGAVEDPDVADQVRKDEDKIDILYEEIVEYLRAIHINTMTPQQSREFVELVAATDNLESIGDIIATDLLQLVEEARAKGVRSTDTLREMYVNLFGAIVKAVEAAIQAVEKADQQSAQDVLAVKDDIHRLVDQALHHQVGELTAAEPTSLATFRLEMEVVDKLKRIYALTKRVARGALPDAVEVRE